ncbi:hypothetical protein GUITHDRAFT_136919 [Guillardia theta CCMP2712]|uniref:Uncharacterized protein n=1 Tax=Guillardia theta (strain CCMP2712) TaxID=905079 RepID=L1JJT8_GUITC|nr:hypothetical protein GUITHDRAFT_136919 [Guillardia theta CCMP2712]EKX48424.1 hypothetical protein GUITHDRAFT_136919 [Guillardia theta CCMP2712]|eukprot:XP_005835404.1 hypothetical protein GUITHDRAFT_136919 [Guillardia theta CCMP2712]
MTNRSPVPTPNSLDVRSMNTPSIAPTIQTSESQELGGIGIVLQPSRSNPQNMEIMHLFNGGPAQTSGLVAVGDVQFALTRAIAISQRSDSLEVTSQPITTSEYGKIGSHQVGEEKTAPVPTEIPVVSSGKISTFSAVAEHSTINSNSVKAPWSSSPKSNFYRADISGIGDAVSESERHSARSIDNKKGKRSKESLRTITAIPEYSNFSQEELRASYYLEKMTETTSVNPPGYMKQKPVTAQSEPSVSNNTESVAPSVSMDEQKKIGISEDEKASFVAWKVQQERELEEKRLQQEHLFAEQMKIAADLEKQQSELLQKQMALEQKEKEIQDMMSVSNGRSFKEAGDVEVQVKMPVDDRSKRAPTDEELTEAALAMLPSALDDIRLGSQSATAAIRKSHHTELEVSQKELDILDFESKRTEHSLNDSMAENMQSVSPELVSLTLDLEYDQFLSTVARKSAFQNQLKKDIVSALNTDEHRVVIIALNRGSIIAEICLMPAQGDSDTMRDNRTPKVLAYELAAQVSDPSSALRAAITTKKACRAILRGPPGPNQIIQDTVKISTICSPRGSLSTEISPSKPEIPSRWAVLDRNDIADEREMSAYLLNNERSKSNLPESSLTGSWNYDAVTDGLLPSPSRIQSKSPGQRSSDPLYASLPAFSDPVHATGTSPLQSALSPQFMPSIFASAGAYSTTSSMSLPGAGEKLLSLGEKVIEALASTGTDLLKRGRYQQARKYLKEALDGSKSLQAAGHTVPSNLTFKIFDGLAIVGNLEQDEPFIIAEDSEKLNLWSSNGMTSRLLQKEMLRFVEMSRD